MKKMLVIASIAIMSLLMLGQLLPQKLVTKSVAAQSSSLARIYFVDIGQGAGTLIVSPTGKTLLVDGGPGGGGTTKIIPLLNTLGISTIDFTVLSHYHIDHNAGLTEVFNAGRVAGIAYDNGDAADVMPPNNGSTRTAYLNYISSTNRAGVTRQTIQPGQVIDMGGGMRATCIVSGGRFIGGANIPINTGDVNNQSITVLVEYNNFDYLVGGDLTGGGTTGARGIDLESFVSQLTGDIDVAQLNHHGSNTSSNQRMLSAIKAEVAVAQMGSSNTFGHPTQEIANRFLNTPATNGNNFTGTTAQIAGQTPAFYQTQQSPSNDSRVTQQGIFAAASNNAGNGTILLQTDGTTTYSLMSFDDGGVRISPSLNTYPIDGANMGVTTDFAPVVIPTLTPEFPLATEAVTFNVSAGDDNSTISNVTLNYSLDGVMQTPITLTGSNGSFQGMIPAQPDGTRVDYTVTATAGGKTSSFSNGYFSGTTPINKIRALKANGEPLYLDYRVRVVGTSTVATGSFNGSSSLNDEFIEDGTAALNVFRSSRPSTNPVRLAVGQRTEVRGRIFQNQGVLRLDATPDVTNAASAFGFTDLGPAPAPVTPLMTTLANVSSQAEMMEGRLVMIPNVTITGTIPTIRSSNDSFVAISDGTASFQIRIDSDSDVTGLATPRTPIILMGIVTQSDGLRPFDTQYNITPRNRADLGANLAGATLVSIAEARADIVDNTDSNPPADFVPDLIGQGVKVRGVVTSIDFRGGNGIEYYIQDQTGGIDIFNSTTNFGPYNIGDNIEVTGSVTQFNGLTEVDPGSTITNIVLLPSGTLPAVSPQTVTLSQLADGGVGENLEGRLIRVNNVRITSGTFPAANASGNVTVTDGTASVILRVDSDTNIDGTTTPSGTFSVIGLAGQFDSAAPFDAGYQILPRSLDDITAGNTVLTTSPTTVDFGMVTIGGANSSTITITNTSASSVMLSTPFMLGGMDAAQFTVGTPATTTLAPNASTTVNVSFVPTTPGTKTAMLTISTTANDMATVMLTGTVPGGGGGGVVISEFRLRGPLGGNDEFVEIYNNSDTPVDIGGWKLRGSNNAAGVTDRATVAAGVILPGRSYYLFTNSTMMTGYSGTVRANMTYGTGIGDDGGLAIVDANATIIDQVGLSTGSAFGEGTRLPSFGSTNSDRSNRRKMVMGMMGTFQDTQMNLADFDLNTTPSDPQNIVLAASPNSVNFGNLNVSQSATAMISVANRLATNSTVTITSISVTGTNASEFMLATPPTGNIASNASVMLSVTFQPMTAGTKSAAISFVTNQGTTMIPLTAVAGAGISVTPTTVNFGTETLGSTTSSMIMISNPTATTITLTPPFMLTGTDTDQFSVGSLSATQLAPNDTAMLTVNFTPTSVGSKTATLTITSANGGSQMVTLNGTGICPTITLSPATLPNAIAGVSYSQQLSASPMGMYTFAVTAGSLPTGITLSSDGLLSGTTMMTGSFTFTVTATDANMCMGSKAYTLTVSPACPTITLSPTSLPNANAGTNYSQQLSASPMGTYTFAVTAGSLPTGITLSSAGLLSGTTMMTGSFTFTVTATDANMCMGSQAYTLMVAASCGTLTLSPATISNPIVGIFYSVPFTTSPTGQYTYSITSGTLPTGLNFSTQGGITGVPSTTGMFTFTVMATATNGCSTTRTYSVNVTNPCPTFTFSPASLPVAAIRSSFNQQLAISPTGTYSFAITAGALPTGMTLSSTGLISGMVNTTGNFNFTVTATNTATNCKATKTYTLTVACPQISLTPSTFPTAFFNVAYSQKMVASGGFAPYTFRVSAGRLPNGMTLATDGTLRGTPTSTTNATFTVTVTDSSGCQSSQTCSINICIGAAAKLSDLTATTGTVNGTYSQTIQIVGNIAPRTFTVTGSLPPGITLRTTSTTAALIGRFTTAGTYNFVITANDGKCAISRQYTIVVQ
jgi:beta-lactamase superfamily II metal-dependent hydrolase/DNA/RNA endonuclease YhcR with UshA esterase domain